MLVVSASTARGLGQTLEERGQEVYAEQRCSLCHSIGDDGNAKGPLDGVGARLSVEVLERWMVAPKEMTVETGSTRKPAMRAYPSLSAEDREAVVAYMLSLKDE
jgi:mono/diheme cytochrome c family protein